MIVRAYNIVWGDDIGGQPQMQLDTRSPEVSDYIDEDGALDIRSALEFICGRRVVSFNWRELLKERKIGVFSVTIGREDRVYGGSEEGGWWYNHFTAGRIITVPARREEALRRRLDEWVRRRNEGKRSLSSMLGDTHDCYQIGVVETTKRQYYS